ncbi:ribonuclease PH [bacterium]|nr:ribonuclease PH [bacterium]
MRTDKRKFDEIRKTKIKNNYLKGPMGSVLIEVGDTKVICTCTVENRVPPFLKDKGQGWITAEYGMLPGSTHTRNKREASNGKISGRTAEIQRLIGRSLRSVIDLEKLGEITLHIDCDVIQADGGTRTASITGSFVALLDALLKLKKQGQIKELPIKEYLAAVSVGIIEGKPMLDLCYEEDSSAEVDMNIIMTGKGDFVEIQGTAEKRAFSKKEMNEMMKLAEKGVKELVDMQKAVLKV